MKSRTLLTLASAMAALWMAPAIAHHNSPMSVELPDHALEVHNAAVDAVLDRLEDLGVAGMMAGERTTDMDPADNAAYAGPSAMEDVPGSSSRLGRDRAPELSPEPPL